MRISVFFLFSTAVLALLPMACDKQEAPNQSDVSFYGTDNRSGVISFATHLLMDLPAGVTTVGALAKKEHQAAVRSVIELQVQHIFGAFTEHKAYKKNPGIVLTDPRLSQIKISADHSGDKKRARISYHYEDTVVFSNKVRRQNIKFHLPLNPKDIYKNSMMPLAEALKFEDQLEYEGELEHFVKDVIPLVNMCTDLHYQDESDFWYFWNPDAVGCVIKKEQLVEVIANIDKVDNTKKTFPLYDEMLQDGVLSITYLVGIDESYKKDDLGKQSFNRSLDYLQDMGFELEATSSDTRNPNQKRLTMEKNGKKVIIDMSLVDTATKRFLRNARRGLQQADVFIYDGHSGLGGHLYVDRFEDELGEEEMLVLDPDRAQIYYFNGCSTYAYYNRDYFMMHGGSEKLDIMTTSIGALFSVGAEHDVSLIDSLVQGLGDPAERPSWQQIIDAIYDSGTPEDSPLVQVNGDEDNPTTAGE